MTAKAWLSRAYRQLKTAAFRTSMLTLEPPGIGKILVAFHPSTYQKDFNGHAMKKADTA